MDKKEYKELSAMAANGDTKAFAYLYETVYREMYYTAYYSLKNDADAVEAVTGTIRDGFEAIKRLNSEAAFRLFMLKSLCARIKLRFKEYSRARSPGPDDKKNLRPNEDGIDIKQEFNKLPDTERMVMALCVIGRFPPEEIAQFTGMSAGAVRKRLTKAVNALELE